MRPEWWAVPIADSERITKARQVLADPTHPQHQQLVDALDTAIALDPPTTKGQT